MNKKVFRRVMKENYNKVKNIYLNRFYDMYMSSRMIIGDIDDEQNYYILKKLWCNGSVLGWVIDKTDVPGFAPYSVVSYNMYDFPEKVMPINTRSVSNKIIPNREMIVNKDCVIIYGNKSHRPISEIIEWYCDRIATVEVIINNNLLLQNMPFLIKGFGKNKNKDRAVDLVERLLEGDLILEYDGEVSEILDVVNLNAPLIIQDLQDYKSMLINDVLTIIGVNNNPVEKRERLIVDEVNANNEFIDVCDDVITDEINEGCERFKKYLGIDLTVISKHDKILMSGSDEEGEESE